MINTYCPDRKSKLLPRSYMVAASRLQLNTAAGAGALTVTASQPGFTMMMPIWGTVLNAPSASTSVPF